MCVCSLYMGWCEQRVSGSLSVVMAQGPMVCCSVFSPVNDLSSECRFISAHKKVADMKVRPHTATSRQHTHFYLRSLSWHSLGYNRLDNHKEETRKIWENAGPTGDNSWSVKLQGIKPWTQGRSGTILTCLVQRSGVKSRKERVLTYLLRMVLQVLATDHFTHHMFSRWSGSPGYWTAARVSGQGSETVLSLFLDEWI